MKNEKTIVSVIPKDTCMSKAPIKAVKKVERDGTTVIVYGRDVEAICPQCGKKFNEHRC